MSPSSSSGGTSLPPLHQAIPEFHSHIPYERRASIPRKVAPPLFDERSRSSAESTDYGYSSTRVYPSVSPTSYSSEPRTPYLPPLTASSRQSSLDGESDRYYSNGGSYSRSHSSDQIRYASSSSGSYARGASPPPTSYSPGSSYGYRSAERTPFSSGPPLELNMDGYEGDRNLVKRRRGNLPKQVTDLLRAWLNDHIHHPYPTEDEKQMLMSQTGLTIHQISNWFINARRRRVPALTSADAQKPRRLS